MTSRVGKARIPSKAGEPIIFSEDQWALVEKAYGHELPEPIRKGILLATEVLRLVGSVELNAPEQKKMIAKTKKLRDAARSLLEETDWPVKEGTAWESIEALTKATAAAVAEFPSRDLQFLTVVHSLFATCNLILCDWESDGGIREGWMWDSWVQAINETMQQHGLPYKTRKDKSDIDQVNSQFVWLIKEIQKHIPKELRRHSHSTDALAIAIHRARKFNWWPKLAPPNISEEAASSVELPEVRAERYKRFRQELAMDPNWVEHRPGSFVRAEIARPGQGVEGEDEQKESKPRDG
jgi:hypothetical protein